MYNIKMFLSIKNNGPRQLLQFSNIIFLVVLRKACHGLFGWTYLCSMLPAPSEARRDIAGRLEAVFPT